MNHESQRRGWPWMRLILTAWAVAIPSVLAALILTNSAKSYGHALFTALPTAGGFVCGLLVNAGRQWNWGHSLFSVLLTIIGVAVGLLLLKVEGAVCLFMAALLVWGLFMIGLVIAWIFRFFMKTKRTRRNWLLLALCSVPLCSAIETRLVRSSPLLEQTTVIEINAPPEVVWRYIGAFPEIEAEPEWIYRAGVAYPLRSDLDGEGVGARRSCVLSTGVMDEVVTVWEPGRRLEFDVLSVPAAMSEASIYDHVETPHLHGYFVPQRGRFVLVALEGGRTRLEGTSWYVHQIWPQWYWTEVTKGIVAGIHRRVLEHIKSLAEKSQ